ncbi:hypothetical protein [Planktothrix paucivesiculata]|uniref:PIN domain-containing protein n=1 Tax=Planktothrix paucivesiculata PCC 9631 TaxID=671071 RepID=A0A7Z9C0U3_9CYAN|nr:hypothetical protein [Planktothrix paucivesiculata]VXD23206.1 hypothetical protein PL9631_710007 [Planktothrix paucivesiculata PCC 9631]
MNCLIDTNIILRLSQPQHPMASQSLNALATLRKQPGNLLILLILFVMQKFKLFTRRR